MPSVEVSSVQATLLVGAGGFVGSVLRYWSGRLIHAYAPMDFPWGTLSINVLGSLLIGVLMELSVRGSLQESGRLLLVVGLLGGFTTFSAFSMETVSLFMAGQTGRAATYVVASMSMCVLAAWAGVAGAKLLP
jgi:fluoride exporter